jgi:WD40 repeat protein
MVAQDSSQSLVRLCFARLLPGIAIATATTVMGAVLAIAPEIANSQEFNRSVHAQAQNNSANPFLQAQSSTNQSAWATEPLLTIADPQVSLGATDTIAISSDGKLVASAVTTDPNHHADSVRVWDLTTGEAVYTFSDHASMVSAIAFSPDGQFLATADYDFDNRMLTIRLRNVSNGQTLHTLRRAITPRFIQDGGGYYFSSVLAFSSDGQTLYSSATSPLIQVWDVNQGVLQRSLVGHRETIRTLQVSPDGQTLASTHVDGRLTLLDLNSGQVKRVFEGGIDAFKVAFSPDNETVMGTFTVRQDGATTPRQIAIWNTTTGEPVDTVTGFVDQDWLILSADGGILAVINYEQDINLLDMATGQPLQTFEEHATNGTFSLDGQLFVAVTEGNIKVWSLTKSAIDTPATQS